MPEHVLGLCGVCSSGCGVELELEGGRIARLKPLKGHPLGIVCGQDDPIAVPSMVDRLHTACPDASVTLLDGVGHYPMVEAPERFAAAVEAALG